MPRPDRRRTVLGRGRHDRARAAPPRSTGGGTGPVHRGYIQQTVRRAGITAQDLRADLLLGQAQASGGDPLQLTHLFGVSDPTAIPYCAELGPPGHWSPDGQDSEGWR
jgi:hypothetical protein